MDQQPQQPKSILKHPERQQEKRLKWDEDNIELTSQDRGTRMKITEPKTPYVHYSDEALHKMDHDGHQLPALQLDKHQNMSSDNTSRELEQRFASHEIEDWPSSDTDGDRPVEQMTELRAKHESFLRKRHEHYKMAEALRRGRELTDDEGSAE